MPKTLPIFPKGWNFAKSGHTAIQVSFSTQAFNSLSSSCLLYVCFFTLYKVGQRRHLPTNGLALRGNKVPEQDCGVHEEEAEDEEVIEKSEKAEKSTSS